MTGKARDQTRRPGDAAWHTWAMLSVQCASSATSCEPDRQAAMSQRHARYCAVTMAPA